MKKSLEEVMKEYQKSLYLVAFNICRDQEDANDIVQDVFLQYYRCKKEFNDENHIRAWLIRVTINYSKNLKLTFWNRNRVSLEELEEKIPFEDPEQLSLFEEMMKLPEKYRTVIHLYYYEDFSVKEIAKILRISEGNAKMQLSRGCRLLKEILAVSGDV